MGLLKYQSRIPRVVRSVEQYTRLSVQPATGLLRTAMVNFIRTTQGKGRGLEIDK